MPSSASGSQRGAYDWAAGLIEFVAVGTAVASERFDLGDETVLSNLSGQQFAQLFRHGWWPVGLVAGTTVMLRDDRLAAACRRCRCSAAAGRTRSSTDFTQGVYARARQRDAPPRAPGARARGAHGVVGVQIEQHHGTSASRPERHNVST